MRDRRHRPSQLSFDEQFYPARPRSFRRRRVRPRVTAADIQRMGPAKAENRKYVDWLRRHSMLRAARATGRNYSGSSVMWRNPFSTPRPRAAVRTASVWFTAYPLSLITRPGESYLRTLGDESLWDAFAQIGINAVHAWSEGHPLSEAANQLIGSMVRKMGGFTFQELNLTIDDIKFSSETGAAPGHRPELRIRAGSRQRAIRRTAARRHRRRHEHRRADRRRRQPRRIRHCPGRLPGHVPGGLSLGSARPQQARHSPSEGGVSTDQTNHFAGDQQNTDHPSTA